MSHQTRLAYVGRTQCSIEIHESRKAVDLEEICRRTL